MSQFDLDILALAKAELPPDHRTNIMSAIAQQSISPTQWLHDLIFVDYLYGTTYATYSNVTAYVYGNKVTYNKGVYECINKSGSTGHLPTDTNYWYLRQANFIGSNERVKYNSQTLVLTYGLNRWFGTTFRQPPSISDIYIAAVTPTKLSFLSYKTETGTDHSFDTYSTGWSFNTEVFGTQATYTFSVNIPAAVYAALGATAEKIVRQFVDKYNIAGITYTVLTY